MTSNSTTVTFPISFDNTNYSIVVTPTNTSQFVFHIGTKSVDSVIIHSTGSDEIKGFNYQVIGRKTAS